tara:strand:+ start:2170 stop:3147 length:978 start_codon:yes stop_codon:yes gene_type:complete
MAGTSKPKSGEDCSKCQQKIPPKSGKINWSNPTKTEFRCNFGCLHYHYSEFQLRPPIENKSTKTGKKDIQGSAHEAWKSDKLPKLLLVWEMDKERCKIEREKAHSRDVEGTITGFHMYYIRDDSIIVPWTDKSGFSREELKGKKLNPGLKKQLGEIAKEQNKKYSSRSILLTNSFKNTGDTIRIQLHFPDHTTLPSIPREAKNEKWYTKLTNTCERMIGTKIRLKKFNKPGLAGERVWLNCNILKMEDRHKQQTGDSAKSKDPGELYIQFKGDEEWINIKNWNKGREEYWLGDAIDFIMEHIDPNLIRSKTKSAGVDILGEEEKI